MTANPDTKAGCRPSAMTGFQATLIGTRQRLHIQHGPIDLVIDADGPGRLALFERAVTAAMPILATLVDELDMLRAPYRAKHKFTGPVARRMQAVCALAEDRFVTPMIAVAGSVADHVLAAMQDDDAARSCRRISVNNGGDIAFWTASGATTRAQISGLPAGILTLAGPTRWQGIATSGWGGRSHSRGIADSVTVLADSAALADIAATLIANDVDLPNHPMITRQCAHDLDPASDLADRMVTTGVPVLDDGEIGAALAAGRATASRLMQQGSIAGAVLVLQGQNKIVGLAAGILADQPFLSRTDDIRESCHA